MTGKYQIIAKCLQLLLLMLFSLQVFGQERFPESGVLFDPDDIPLISITLDPDTLDLILQSGNEDSNIEYMATFEITSGNYSETIDSVGFRLRGNTSRNASKKSFKVSLNRFIKGQQFQGVEKINLNGEHNDPSMSRARISWDIFRKAGVPAPRSNHVLLYINNEFKGVYLNVEHIDEEFTDLRFGNNSGNLFKCLWPADLAYIGSSPDLYKFDNGGRLAYELKRDDGSGDYSDLANLIDVINNSAIEDLPQDLNLIFNVNIYLKNLAVEVLTGHWDAYAYLKNNYYLYHNLGTGKFEYIPYDTDNTLGIDFFGIDWAYRNIYNWSMQEEARPLVERLLQNELYFDRFSFYVEQIINDIYNSSQLDPFINDIRSHIQNEADFDLYRSYDYGYTYDDFYNAFDYESVGPASSGIKEFISKRSASAIDQLSINKIDPIISLLYVREAKLNENTKIEFLVEDDDEIQDVKIWFADGEDFVGYNPVNEGEGIFSFSYSGLAIEGEQRYYLRAQDVEMNTTRDPVQGWYTIKYGLNSNNINTANRQINLSVYPNPTSEFLYISVLEHVESFKYKIYNTKGQTVMHGQSDFSELKINLDMSMENGLYFLEIQFENGEGGIGISNSKFVLSRDF